MDMVQTKVTQPRAVLLPWWSVQLLGWMLYCVVTFLSLTLWYGDPQWLHVVQIFAEACLGAALTIPLGFAIKYAARGSISYRLILHLFIVAITAFIWNVMRMYMFETLFPGSEIWQDFGGWYFASILIFSLWTALYYSIRAYSAVAAEQERALNEKLRRITAESLSRDSQLQMLRYQINPHFIFNTMNSINALVATERSKEARQMIDQFSSYLRITLEGDKNLFVSLDEEIEAIEGYLSVEKMRFHERLQMQIDIPEHLSDIMVPSLILQPLVENAVRHGVEGQRQTCLIKVSAQSVDDRLILKISNNGPPLKITNEDALSHERKEGGVGLKNVRSRLDTVYDGDYIFSLEQSDKKTVTALISIPLSIDRDLS